MLRRRARRTATTGGYGAAPVLGRARTEERLRLAAMAFLAAAVLSALVYAGWVLWVPLLPDNLYVPLLDLGKITGYRWPSAILFLMMVLGLYSLYGLGYRFIQGRRSLTRALVIFGAGTFFCLELLWAYPATAVDVFGYI